MLKDSFIGEEMKDSKDKDTSTTRHTCLVCCEKKPNAVLMECGHGGLFLKILLIYFLIKEFAMTVELNC